MKKHYPSDNYYSAGDLRISTDPKHDVNLTSLEEVGYLTLGVNRTYVYFWAILFILLQYHRELPSLVRAESMLFNIGRPSDLVLPRLEQCQHVDVYGDVRK